MLADTGVDTDMLCIPSDDIHFEQALNCFFNLLLMAYLDIYKTKFVKVQNFFLLDILADLRYPVTPGSNVFVL